MIIRYPDGSEAKIGDALTLGDGLYTGTVLHVLTSSADLKAWGLDVPGLMIDTSFGGLVFYPHDHLAGDWMELKSRAETYRPLTFFHATPDS